MASQTLTTIIAINAQANGFGQVGATLTELGTIVNGVSQQLINFGKESWEVYKDYEKSMHEAEVALSTSHGRNTKELAAAMDTLNAKATEWAATTIFHTDDVANAINQAAHAGWDLDEILTGIPVAMQLAQAGSMDLSDALTYITKSMSAFGVPFDEMGEFVDMWVYAANSSVGDVQDFGDAMKKLGATMRFTDSKEELFALIGLMHDMGESGSTAATLLRTSMMRIIAPSGVASKVMEELGATDEEIREIREDASKLAALQTLEDYGFNAFKDDNQAKPMIQIYAELGEVLAEIAGGYDNITKNQTTLGILSTIFGTRGITGALDIVTALENAVELRDKLLAGNAEGYGSYAAETMMDTAYGKSEIFESKIERLKQVVGEELSGELESVMESIGGIVDDIADMDEGKFSALVAGLKVIALAGPGLLLAGGAFRLIGMLLTPAGGIGLGLIALTAAAAAIEKLQEADLSNTFGDMELDTEGIKSYVKELGEDFNTAYTETDKFAKALDDAVNNYRNASSTFSSNIFSLMIKNTKLTQDDLDELLQLGSQMYEYVQEAIYSAASGDAEYWTELFGEDAASDAGYQKIIEAVYADYQKDLDELESIGKTMRETITNAFTNDGEIDEDEYNKILETMRQYNRMVADAAAEAQKEEEYVGMRMWLQKAQTASLEDMKELSETAKSEREKYLSQSEERFWRSYYRLESTGALEGEEGEALAQELKDKHEKEQKEIDTRYDEFLLTMWDSQLSNNEQRENWTKLKEIAEKYTKGIISTYEALDETQKALGISTYSGDPGATILHNDSARGQIAKLTGNLLEYMGGKEAVQSKIDYYREQGNEEMADRLTRYLAAEQLANGFYDVIQTSPTKIFGAEIGFLGDYHTNAQGYSGVNQRKKEFEEKYIPDAISAEDARAALEVYDDMKVTPRDFLMYAGQALKDQFAYQNLSYEFNDIGIRYAGLYEDAYNKMQKMYDFSLIYEEMFQEYGAGLARFTDEYGNKIEGTESFITNPYAVLYYMTYGPGAGHANQFLKQPAQTNGEPDADAGGKTTEDTGTITKELRNESIETGQEVEQLGEKSYTATGHITMLGELAGGAEHGVQALGDASAAASDSAYSAAAALGSIKAPSLFGDLFSGFLFAEGGRADEPSIFGEGDTAEWAIPEQHSERTADLLNAARVASGFTWNELLARFGGLNANPQKNNQTTIVYSPTINAQDASGVDQALKDDKTRFEKWFKDQQMRDAAEVYA